MASEYTNGTDGLSLGGNTVFIGGEPRVYLTINLPGGAAFSFWASIEQMQNIAAHVSLLARKEPEHV